MKRTPLAKDDLASALWTGWRLTELVEDRVTVDGVELRRAAVSVAHDRGMSAFGSAVSSDDDPVARAKAETLERMAIVEAEASSLEAFVQVDEEGRPLARIGRETVFPRSNSDAWQYSRSNGVAAGNTWASACENARLELVERDAILRAWYAQRAPTPLHLPPSLLPRTRSYSWNACVIQPSEWAQNLSVAATFAFPNDDGMPLLRGFGAGNTLHHALKRSVGECLQNLAFLTEDPLPTRPPEPSASPLFHLDTFLCPSSHGRLKDWLSGQVSVLDNVSFPPIEGSATLSYADLTPATATTFKVVRALCPNALNLTFGDGPSWVPPTLRAHPIA